MHFYGGGYSDIKRTNGSWVKCFEDLRAGDAWVCGYREMRDGVAYIPGMDIRGKWHDLIGNCAYICKAQTPLTTDWYNEMIALLDRKLDALKAHPARHPRDKKEEGHGYPIEWNEMLGRIFHKICYKHKEKLLITLPTSDFSNYQ